jgi:hypothetical protein
MRRKKAGRRLSVKDIRMQYSGLIIFAAKLTSVLTGLIFQFIIARELSGVEYDLWFNINDVSNYFVLMAGVLPFWAMRYVTRDKEAATKTGIVGNLAISGVAAGIYILFIPTVMSALHISSTYLPTYLLISIQIIEVYSIGVLEPCLQPRKPQAIGYGLLAQQVAKVSIAYLLIIVLQQFLVGAVVATLAGFAIQILYYSRLVAAELNRKIRFEYIREWLKGSLGNIYNVVGNQLATVIFIMLFAFGGEGARGILGAGAVVVNVITYSSFLSYALYPKLMADKNCEDATSCMKMVLMFAIPMTIGAIALADSFMVLLRPEFAAYYAVLAVLAVDAFVSVISSFYLSILYGFETVDDEAKLSLRKLVKSKMFIAFSLPYLHSAFTLPTAYYVLTNFANDHPYQAALYVSIINAVVRTAMFLILFIVVRKAVMVRIPWRNIGKYLLSAATMGIVLYIIPHPTRISLILAETALGGLIYLGLLFLIDKEARKLPKDIIQEFR